MNISVTHRPRITNTLVFVHPQHSNITYAASAIAELENVVNSELRNVTQPIVTTRLSLNVAKTIVSRGVPSPNYAKTEFMVFGSNERIHALTNNQINIEMDGKSIEKFQEARSQITGLGN